MPDPRIKNPAPSVTLSPGSIAIRDASIFSDVDDESCLQFLSRVLAIAEVRSVSIDRDGQVVSIRHDVGRSALSGLLEQLATVLRGIQSADAPVPIPALPAVSRFSIHRHGTTLTTWEVVDDQPGRLKLRHEALRDDPVLADRIARELRALSGVRVVKLHEGTGHLLIRYEPAVISARALLGRAEVAMLELTPHSTGKATLLSGRFGMANLTLGIAVVGELLLPILLPISAVLLVLTNLPTFRAARLQLKSKRLGLPVLYLAIVGITLATGQFVASALMTWTFRFWHRRFRVELASERTRLLAGSHDRPVMARLLIPSGAEVLVTVGRLKVGDRLIVGHGETIPADGRIMAGEGVVDERAFRGGEGISRKRVGDALMDGTTVLAGAFQVEVARLGDRTRGASIRRALIAATSPTPGHSAPTSRSEAFASRAVGPTLATAGIGLLAGDLLTVGAILRPDYATGPGLAVPLETLHNVTLCARMGIVARDPEALERLSEVDLFVLQDHPILWKTELDVARIDTRLPEAILLRYAASAFRHLVDDRATALVELCRARRIHLLNLEALEFGRGVTVAHGDHRIRIFDADASSSPSGPLAVEVEGTVVGIIEFAPSQRLEAASAIDQVRRGSHVPFALVSSRGGEEIAGMAKSLGVEMFRGDFDADQTAEFLAACKRKGLKVAFVGDCRVDPRSASMAHVAISIVGDDEADLDLDPAGLLMQQPRLDPLVDLNRISRSHASRVIQAQRLILVPNLLCVAGAFLFGFTGMTAVMLSNLGTLGLYRIASDSLRGLDSPKSSRSGQPRRAG